LAAQGSGEVLAHVVRFLGIEHVVAEGLLDDLVAGAPR
jgi:hypothetical protein